MTSRHRPVVPKTNHEHVNSTRRWSSQIRVDKQKRALGNGNTDRDHEDDAHNISLINWFCVIQEVLVDME